jgi:hypothetical protein
MGSVRGAWLGGADRAAASALATLSATASESIPAASQQPRYELTISEGGETRTPLETCAEEIR